MSPSENLKRFMSETGLTQQQIAEKINISRSMLSYYIRGASPIPQKFAMALQLEYGLNAEWLYDNTGDMLIERKTWSREIQELVHNYEISDIPTQTFLKKISDLMSIDANRIPVITENYDPIKANMSEYMLLSKNIIDGSVDKHYAIRIGDNNYSRLNLVTDDYVIIKPMPKYLDISEKKKYYALNDVVACFTKDKKKVILTDIKLGKNGLTDLTNEKTQKAKIEIFYDQPKEYDPYSFAAVFLGKVIKIISSNINI